MAKKHIKIDPEDLDELYASIEKKYGEGILIRPNKTHILKSMDIISTGLLGLDVALGVKGFPKGRIIEVYGAESSGKTSLTYNVIKQMQQTNGKAAFIDMEHAFDYMYAEKMGINLQDLLISQPDFGEQALDIVQMLVESNLLDLIIIDSVAALTPKAEIEGEMGESKIGLQARLMSQAMRKLSGIVSKTKTCVVFINQTRQKIGVMFGSNVTTPGGLALKFYSSIRIELKKIKTILQGGDKAIGTTIRAKVVKNKVAPPFQTTTFDIYFDEGISTSADVLNNAISHGIVKKSGAWLIYKEEKLAHGMEKARQLLRSNLDLLNEIRQKVCDLLAQTKENNKPPISQNQIELITAGKQPDITKDVED